MSRGFILQPTYRTEAGRPVVLIYGVLDSGGPFLIRDTRQRPYFYVDQRDAAAARRCGASVRDDQPPRAVLGGGAAVRVEVGRPQELAALRDRLTAAGIDCLEADIRFAYRFLIDRGIRACVKIEGEGRTVPGVGVVFEDPRLAPDDWLPQLSVLSLDIETDPAARRLLSIALCSRGTAEVLLLTPPGYDCPVGALACRDERELLTVFVRRVRELDPDVLTGWNVVDFDLTVLARVARRCGVPLALGRGGSPLRLQPAASARTSARARVEGRVVLDGIELLRGAFIKLDSYALDAAARTILGRRKTLRGPDRAEAILRAFEEDRRELVDYNLNDARLVLEILDTLRLIELTVERSRLTGMPPDRVTGSVAAFDYLYLTELKRRRIVAPRPRAAETSFAATAGGHVLAPRPGLYRNVVVFDFKSLYPSIIRTFQIDPLGFLPAATDEDDPIVAPNGAAFRRQPGVLPALLDGLFPRREAAQAAGDAIASQAIKILMNSFYGVLGTPACRFASPVLANAITGFGRQILLWAKRHFESAGHQVLYGDTDSLFVLTDRDDREQAARWGKLAARRLNRDLARHVSETWRVTSRLQLQVARVYLKLLLPAVRHGTVGARKRYAGLVREDGQERVVFTGMEVVRRDWTALAKRVQRELYQRLFAERSVDDYLRQAVADLRAGRLDDQLVYRKGLRKRLRAYTAATPPHVAAARKMTRRPGRIVSYVITRDGAEPAGERRAPIDHEHYVQKQVRPVAEPVLAVLGLDFDRIVGDESQLRLF